MGFFHNSSAMVSKKWAVLISLLLTFSFIAGCVDNKERSAKNKVALLQAVSEFSAMQDKVIAMMERGEAAEAKRFASTALAEKHTEIKSSIDDKVLNQLITEEDNAAVLKELADKEAAFKQKMSAFK